MEGLKVWQIAATGTRGAGTVLYGDGRWAAPGGGGTVADSLAAHRFVIAAHRGDIGSADSYPENSMEAIRQAGEKGAAIVECDAIQSADGTFWLNHDASVNRTTNGSGNVSALTDAALAALHYDAGYGYDVGRHGTSVGLCTLAEAFDALEQYGTLLSPQLNGGSATDLAQQVIDAGWSGRCIIEVATLAAAAQVKAVSETLTVLVNVDVSGATASADVDWHSWDSDDLTSLAAAQAVAPKIIKAYTSIADYGTDETTALTNALDFGARAFQTNDLDAALLILRGIEEPYQLLSEKGDPNGYASLGPDGIVPDTQLPAWPVALTHALVPLTTVVGGVPELVWEADNSLSLTEVPL